MCSDCPVMMYWDSVCAGHQRITYGKCHVLCIHEGMYGYADTEPGNSCNTNQSGVTAHIGQLAL